MIKSGGFFIILFVWTSAVCFSQNSKVSNALDKGKFYTDFGMEIRGRNFEQDTFLGDAYQTSLGFRMTLNLGIVGYPGLGWYGGGQGATVLENQFLGGFFDQARLRDGGIFVYHSFPVGTRFVIRPELGFGGFRVIHGVSPSRFILNYTHFFARLGAEYPLLEISKDLRLSLSVGASYGIYTGKNIIINKEDRSYIQRSSDFQISSGILIKIH